MDYETLSAADQLLLARDLLRAKESDHFRLSLVNEPNTENRISELEGQIKELKEKVSTLEAEEAPDDAAEKPKAKPRARRKAAAKKDE